MPCSECQHSSHTLKYSDQENLLDSSTDKIIASSM